MPFNAFSNPDNMIVTGNLTVQHSKRLGNTGVSFDDGLIVSDGLGNLIANSFTGTGTGGAFTVANVQGYGAKGDANHDDTSAIQSAINAVQTAGGGIVFFPLGIYKLTSPVTISIKNIILMGVGVASAILIGSTFSGAAAIILTGTGTSGASDCQIRDLYFKGNSSTYTNNPVADAIQVNHSTGLTLQNILFHYMNGWCVDLINDATGTCYFPNLIGIHVSGDCKQGIRIHGDFADGNYNSGAYLANCNLGGTQNGDGLLIEDAHDVTIINSEGGVAGGGNTIHLLGDTASIFVVNSDLGSLINNAAYVNPQVLIESNANGEPNGVYFVGGILETGTPNVSITAGHNIQFNNIRFFKGGNYGISASGTTDTVIINACEFDSNGWTAGASNYDINWTSSGHIKITDSFFKTLQGTTQGKVKAAGNFTAGTSEVLNCSFLGANGGSNTFDGTPKIARGNNGYNPVGNLNVSAVGTSPFTYPILSVDATYYISGGTVSVIAVGSMTTGLTSGTLRVPAQQSITITHTGAPTVNAFGD